MVFFCNLWVYYSRISNKISGFLKKQLHFIILVDLDDKIITIFFATRIRINVSWSGSGSSQMIRIQPDPKHCMWGLEAGLPCCSHSLSCSGTGPGRKQVASGHQAPAPTNQAVLEINTINQSINQYYTPVKINHALIRHS